MQAGSSLPCRFLQINQPADEADKFTQAAPDFYESYRILCNRKLTYVPMFGLQHSTIYFRGVSGSSNALGCVWFISRRYGGSFLVSSDNVAFIALLFACWRRLRVLEAICSRPPRVLNIPLHAEAVMNCNMFACGTPPPLFPIERCSVKTTVCLSG